MSNKTPEQVSDEDYKTAPTSADKKHILKNKENAIEKELKEGAK